MKIDLLDKNFEFKHLKQKIENIDNNKKCEEQSTNNSDIPEKKLLKDKNYMISILKQKYPSFLETFELEE
jgi:hypothetical protein